MIVATIYGLAAVIVLLESLNKLERTHVLEGGLSGRNRCVAALKFLGWALLAVGSAGALAAPFLKLSSPDAHDACILAGFAIHIVRSRLKEGFAESDDFTQTRVLKGRP